MVLLGGEDDGPLGVGGDHADLGLGEAGLEEGEEFGEGGVGEGVGLLHPGLGLGQGGEGAEVNPGPLQNVGEAGVLLGGGENGENGLEPPALLHHDPVHVEPRGLPGEEGEEVVLDPGLGALNVDDRAGLALGVRLRALVGDLGDAHDVGPTLHGPRAARGVHQGGDHLGGGHHHHVGGQEEVVQAVLVAVGGEEEVPDLPEGLALEVQLDVGQGGWALAGSPLGS